MNRTHRPSRPRVLVLARAYPNAALPVQGLWTERLVRASLEVAEPTVVAPIPYCPPGVPIEAYARYRRVSRTHLDPGFPVHHPRVPVGPGSLLQSLDARLAYPFVRRLVDRLHRDRPFALIHAHFIYPDGVLAARLGRLYRLPVVTTEHSLWEPILTRYPQLRNHVLRALPHIRMVTGVSEAVCASFAAVAGDRVPLEVLPNVIDEANFPPPSADEAWDPEQILFVGAVRHVKGLDVLVRAMKRLTAIRPALRLVVVGAPFLPAYQRDERTVRRLVAELDLESRVDFVGPAQPSEVAAAMRRSALLVSPSRREALGAVLLEALASGTPVVATRSGGPEEVVTPDVGRLVPPEDPEALATAIDEMLTLRPAFDRTRLREHVLSRFGETAVTARLESIYGELLR